METREVKNAAIRVENLVKTFKDVRAVDGVSFAVEEGELFAFLGENGAGKSTSIAVICGLLQKDGGKVYVAGRDTDESDSAKSEIGVVFQSSVLDKALSARDNLRSRAALYGIVGKAFQQRLCELDGLLAFGEFIDRPLGRLSGGQKRKIDIARALVHHPKILILDEPTTGLDPQTRKTVWEAVQKLRNEEKMTVFLTTHYMEEAAKADYVVILDRGKVAAEGTPHMLKNKYTGDFIVLYGVSREAVISALGKEWLDKTAPFAGGVKIRVENTAQATKLIVAYPRVFNDYEVLKGNMDDVFLAVTGKTLKKGVEQ
ncbi:MAG: ATP-binding cassette domain-containing protein [Candidatus Borkfalkiaceae bacterium]|nr:ATP-binding cassette domain-containing protein [Clostridia bacterium]MDY6224092.1 ATP-binding cassette domain-containing protein [Christensenellaceae bacterium]